MVIYLVIKLHHGILGLLKSWKVASYFLASCHFHGRCQIHR